MTLANWLWRVTPSHRGVLQREGDGNAASCSAMGLQPLPILCAPYHPVCPFIGTAPLPLPAAADCCLLNHSPAGDVSSCGIGVGGEGIGAAVWGALDKGQ